MLSSNQKLLKNTNLSKEVVHLDEHLCSLKNDYVDKTAKLELEKQIAANKEIASKIISEANTQAELIISLADEEVLERAKKEVEAEIRSSLEKEYSELYETRFNEVSALYEQANNHLISTYEELKNKRQEWVTLNQSIIQDVIIKTVELITDSKDIAPNETTIANFETALTMTENVSETIWVKVHPVFKEYLLKKGITDTRITFIADIRLMPNDFIFELDDEIIDSTLETKLNNLKSILSKWVESIDFD